MKIQFHVVKKNKIIRRLFFAMLYFPCITLANTLHVGTGYPYSTLTQATDIAVAGDTILVHKGTYTGGLYIANLQGTVSGWINILVAPGDTVIYDGGSQAWQMTDAAYLHIKGFIFQHQTANGFNLDDGGSYASPSHDILIENCTFQNITATGNNDLLKMSGVDNFEIRNCLFLNGSPGAGDAIDMVGCHDGIIKNSHFENMGAGSIQAKGGSRNIRIEANFFKNGGDRSLNLGGSTGLSYFRPIDVKYEASDLKVYSNTFIGSKAPIAFVGCINTEVVNNTIYLPTQFVVRILQETVDTTRFYPCGYNTFRNNIVYHDSQVSEDCNIGPDTAPATFTFSNNLWYHSQNATWTGPVLPVPDVNSIIEKDPLFINAVSENFNLQPASPAIGKGYAVTQPVQDYIGNNFNNPRSIGGFEANPCPTVSAAWYNSSFTNQTGSFTVEFDATPSGSSADAVLGFSNGSASTYTNLAAIARFNASGSIDARNGDVYAAASTITYSPNVNYHFRLSVNILTHTYSVYVTPAGGNQQTVGLNYAFRTEQNSVTQLNNLSGFCSSGTVQVCNFNVVTCSVVASAWYNSTFNAQAGSFTAEFDATPSNSAADAVIGLSNGNATFYTSLAAIVRFNSSGNIDARNGDVYAAANTIGYTPNIKYHFRLLVNVSTHTYSVYVTPAGGTQQTVGLNYAFRTEQNTVTQLNNLSGFSSTGTAWVCDFSVVNCSTVYAAWYNSSFVVQTGSFTAEFDATPSNSAADAVIGLSNGNATLYTSLAAIVRFNSSGNIDARNGDVYTAANVITYTPYNKYHFRLVVNVSSHTYSVYVTPAGGLQQTVAFNYAFRTEQNTVTQLNNLSGYSSLGNVWVCNISISTTTATSSAGPVAPRIQTSSKETSNPILKEELLIFPNPASNYIAVKTNFKNKGNIQMRIFNGLGEPVYVKQSATQTGKETYKINITPLLPGIYFLEFDFQRNGKERNTEKRVVKILKY